MQGFIQKLFFKMGIANAFKTTPLAEMIVSSSLRTVFARAMVTSSNIFCVAGLFVRGIHRWRVNSPHIGQWRGALMFSSICAWINGWVNNPEAGDLIRYRAHYDVIIMIITHMEWYISVSWTIYHTSTSKHYNPVTSYGIRDLGYHCSGNRLPPGRRKAITWTIANLLSHAPLTGQMVTSRQSDSRRNRV